MVKGAGARRKGAQGEREFFAILNKFLPERLHMKRDLAQTRDSGCDGSNPHVAIEVKRQESLNLPAWLRQAREAATGDQRPVVAYRQNGGNWQILVDMDLPAFAAYLEWRDEQARIGAYWLGQITK